MNLFKPAQPPKTVPGGQELAAGSGRYYSSWKPLDLVRVIWGDFKDMQSQFYPRTPQKPSRDRVQVSGFSKVFLGV